MRIKKILQKEIEEWTQKGNLSVEKILRVLGINAGITFKDLYAHIRLDLKNMGYKIGYDDILINDVKHQSVPSATTKNKIIKLNRNFSKPALLEALIHEYVHIKDDTLPIIEELLDDTKALFDLENLVDIITYTLIMPPDRLKQNLKKNRYQINKILWLYKDFEKCSVLQWITINSLIPCHFAWIMLIQNIKNNDICYDNCFYDQKNDPQVYDIEAVLKTPESAAAKAVKKRKDTKNTQSLIRRKEHQCYAYYESDLKKDICNVQLGANTFYYDRLLVIGWKKEYYNLINS